MLLTVPGGRREHGTRHEVRVADWYAWKIAVNHERAPRFQFSSTQAERDAALVRMRAWVQSQLAP